MSFNNLSNLSTVLRTGMLVQIESTGQVGRISNFHDENPFYGSSIGSGNSLPNFIRTSFSYASKSLSLWYIAWMRLC